MAPLTIMFYHVSPSHFRFHQIPSGLSRLGPISSKRGGPEQSVNQAQQSYTDTRPPVAATMRRTQNYTGCWPRLVKVQPCWRIHFTVLSYFTHYANLTCDLWNYTIFTLHYIVLTVRCGPCIVIVDHISLKCRHKNTSLQKAFIVNIQPKQRCTASEF